MFQRDVQPKLWTALGPLIQLHLKDDSPTATEGGAEAGASGSAAAAGGGGAMADDDEAAATARPRRVKRSGSISPPLLTAGSVARLAKSPLVQLASLLLADRQAHQIRDADTEEAELVLVDEEKEAKEEAELGVRCGQMVRVMAPIETALTNWAAYIEVLTADEKDLNPSIEATLPVILRLMHAAAIDMNGRFDAAAAELDEHDEDDEEEDDDSDVDDVGGGRGRKSRKRKQRKAIAAPVERSSKALSTHLAKAMAELLQRFGTHAGPLRAVLAIVQQMRLASAQATLKDKAFDKMLSELEDVTTKHTDRATLEACGEAWSALLAQPGAPALQDKVQRQFHKLVATLLLQLKPLKTALMKLSSAQGDPPSLEPVSEALVTLHRLEGIAKSQRQPLPGLSGQLGELLQMTKSTLLCANEEEERQERVVHNQATMAAEAALAASSLKLSASVDEPAAAPAEPTAAAVAPTARAHAIALAIRRLSPTGLLQLRRLRKLRALLTKVPAEAQGVLRSAAPAAPAASKLSAQGKGTTYRLLRLQLVQLVEALVVAEETKLSNWAAAQLGSEVLEAVKAARAQAARDMEARAANAQAARDMEARAAKAQAVRDKEARAANAQAARDIPSAYQAARVAVHAKRDETRAVAHAQYARDMAARAANAQAARDLQLDRMRSGPPGAFDVATPKEKSQYAAFFNSGKFAEWSPEILLLVRRTLPDVVQKLTGFVEAAELHERHGYNVAAELDPLVTERLIAIGAVLEPFYLASGAAARDGILPLSYSAAEQASPEACEQRCLTRLVQAFVLLYSPLYRRRAGGQHELVLILEAHRAVHLRRAGGPRPTR